MTALELDWDRTSHEAWHALLAAAGRSSLQQGWAYGAALMKGGVEVHRAVVRDLTGAPLACAQIAVRRVLGLRRIAFLLRGPVRLAPDEAVEDRAVEMICRRLGRAALLWAPERPEPLSRLHGQRPVVTGYSTAWLDLAPGPSHLRRILHGKWRNRLARAERAGIEVRIADPLLVGWLLDRNEQHRRTVGYRGPSRAFLGRLAEAAAAQGDLLALIACEAGIAVAGVLFVRHGAAATYEVGYGSPRGRALRAKHLLLWRALAMLHERGVRWVDLGGIDTDRSPGIARFKLGLGGEPVTLAGTFFWPTGK
ncbi:lipid II:glycine glycyltransferase FemX [Benzoatithermus flavus]|uniref:GNAT family N-acetyltransferase n=1 Tax=Benzoatithermus flavus TaxID=3108223 RepID=A0ABU8XNU1_9PROT